MIDMKYTKTDLAILKAVLPDAPDSGTLEITDRSYSR